MRLASDLEEVKELEEIGLGASVIAKELNIGHVSVYCELEV
jgi:hypothetical protein